MSFVITGLSPHHFSHLFGLPDAVLRALNVIRVTADQKPGYPCRITLEDAEPGESVLLLNHESHAVAPPFASRYAIYVRESARETATFADELAPVLRNREIALRLFNAAGMLVGADMGRNEQLRIRIEAALRLPEVAYIHAHNAMPGCFAATIRRTSHD